MVYDFKKLIGYKSGCSSVTYQIKTTDYGKMEIQMIAHGISCNFPKENIEIGWELLQNICQLHTAYTSIKNAEITGSNRIITIHIKKIRQLYATGFRYF